MEINILLQAKNMQNFGHLAIKFAEGKALIQNKYVLKKAQEYSTTAKNVFVPEPWSVTYQLNRKTPRLRHLSEGRAFGEWICEFMEFNKARNIVRAENKLLESKGTRRQSVLTNHFINRIHLNRPLALEEEFSFSKLGRFCLLVTRDNNNEIQRDVLLCLFLCLSKINRYAARLNPPPYRGGFI